MKRMEEYTPCELATLSTVLGVIIAQKFSTEEKIVVGNFLQGVGQSISIIASQCEYLKKQREERSEDKGTGYKDLQKQIDEIREYIKKLEGTLN